MLHKNYFEEAIEIKDIGFYNPANWIDRQLTKSFINILKVDTFLELTCATGIKSKIISKNCNVNVICNDYNKNIYNILKSELNCYNIDARNEIIEIPFNSLVDLDPFGSALPFLENLSKYNTKYFSICFTDVLNLCSIKRLKYIEKNYNSKLLKTKLTQEQGLRLASKAIVEIFNKQNKKVHFILSYSNLHYLKFYLYVENGINNEISTIKYCENCNTYNECLCNQIKEIGPFYIGSLYDLEIINLLKQNVINKSVLKILEKYNNIDLPFGISIEKICKLVNKPIIKKSKFKHIGVESPYDLNVIKTQLKLKEILINLAGVEPASST